MVLLNLVDARSAGIYTLLITGGISFAGLLLAIVPFVKTISFTSESLREPVRFVQITDVHIGSRSKNFLVQVVGKIRDLDPDFLCITAVIAYYAVGFEFDMALLFGAMVVVTGPTVIVPMLRTVRVSMWMTFLISRRAWRFY